MKGAPGFNCPAIFYHLEMYPFSLFCLKMFSGHLHTIYSLVFNSRHTGTIDTFRGFSSFLSSFSIIFYLLNNIDSRCSGRPIIILQEAMESFAFPDDVIMNTKTLGHGKVHLDFIFKKFAVPCIEDQGVAKLLRIKVSFFSPAESQNK